MIAAAAALPSSFWGWVAYLLRTSAPMFLSGALVTMILAVLGTVAGCVIGFLVGVIQTIPTPKGRRSIGTWLLVGLKWLLAAYIEIFRGTPMIVQATVIYYGSKQMFGVDMSAFVAGLVVVSINTGAYMAESVRGGIDSIDRGQMEAAKAIGMSHFQAMASIIVPQALRNIMPQVGNNLIINIKDTSVLNVISVTELFFTSKSLAGTYYQYFPTYLITCAIYFVMTFSCSRLLRLYERKIDGPSSFELAEGHAGAAATSTGAGASGVPGRTSKTLELLNKGHKSERSGIR
jgi:amine acid ABC transporter, permease protein, 3-TM region, His/Glu/Gln/Arg/opine family